MTFALKYLKTGTGVGESVAKSLPSGLIGDTQLGEFLGVSTKDIWRLKMVDNIGNEAGREFKGQFTAQGLTENVGQRIAETNSLNCQEGNKTYLGGAPNTISFTARIWASSSVRNIKKSIETLKTFTKRDDELKRSPIFIFSAGTEIECSCFVTSIGGIKYDKLRSDGTLRGATLSIQLSKIEDRKTEDQGASVASLVKSGLGIVSAVAGLAGTLGKINIPGGSLHTKGKQIIIKQGQTFEHIAQKHYKDALVGDILRRAYFQQPLSQLKLSLESGDVIDIVDENEIYDIDVTPQSIPLSDNSISKQNILDHLELRGGSKRIYP